MARPERGKNARLPAMTAMLILGQQRKSVIGSRITSQGYSACSILAADRYGDDTIARDEDVNDFFAKWINKLLVDELIAHLEDDIGTVDESAPDHLQIVEQRCAKCVPKGSHGDGNEVERSTRSPKDVPLGCRN